jgi:hypothetical protein
MLEPEDTGRSLRAEAERRSEPLGEMRAAPSDIARERRDSLRVASPGRPIDRVICAR